MTTSILSESEKQRIALAVGATEQQADIEVVVATVATSDGYTFFRLLSAVVFAWSMSLLAYVFLYEIQASYFFLMQVPLFVAGYFIFGIRRLLMAIVPDVYERRCVEREAKAAFADLRVFETKKRNAVLVLASFREQRIAVLPDSEVLKHLPQVRETSAKVWSVPPGVAIVDVVSSMGKSLHSQMPIMGQKINEREDSVIER